MADYLVRAIHSLRPGSQFTISNDDYSTIVWQDLDGSAPTQSEVNAAIEQVTADDIAAKAQTVADKAALLVRLGITADEAKLLLS